MTITATNTVPFGAVEIFELTNKVEVIIANVRDWAAKRATRKALAQLTVSQMEDIGLDGAGVVSTQVHFGRI